jgi:hypothetical protein
MYCQKKARFALLVVLASASAAFVVPNASVNDAYGQDAIQTENSTSERDAAWNDPAMLRARAWLDDYCKSSDVVSEADAAAHMQALESMTPQQMRLFAMTHHNVSKSHPTVQATHVHQQALQHAQQVAASQQWWYQNVHKAEAQQAMQANAATQQAYSNISQEETAAANQAESQFQAEANVARENQASKLDELNNPYPTIGYGNPYYSGYPDTHFHFHLYPNP